MASIRGGLSSMRIHIVEAHGRKGDTIRVSIREPLASDEKPK